MRVANKDKPNKCTSKKLVVWRKHGEQYNFVVAVADDDDEIDLQSSVACVRNY